MKLKKRHREYFQKHNIKNISDVAAKNYELKGKRAAGLLNIEEVQMMLDMAYLLVNNRENLEIFFSSPAPATHTEELLKEAEDHQKIHGRVEHESETDKPCPITGYTLTEEDKEWLNVDLSEWDIETLKNFGSQFAVNKEKDRGIHIIDLSKVLVNPPFDIWQYSYSDTTKDLGKKEKDDKPDYAELDFDYIEVVAQRMSANEQYAPENWKKPMDVKELAKAAIRHARKILQPIDNDPETIADHAAALGANGMMIHYQVKNTLNK